MQVEIINIGTELLIGQVVNTNASYMAKILNEKGFEISRIETIADKEQEIKDSVYQSMERVNILLITGGLGPTNDDITKKCLTDIFGGELKENLQVSKQIEFFFATRKLPYTSTNRYQAYLPDSCIPIFNNVGTAPGMVFYKDNKTIISLPGVPFEMKNIMPEVVRILTKKYNTQVIMDRYFIVSGISESFLSDRLEKFEKELNKNMFSLAYLPQSGIIKLRISLHTSERDRQESEKLMESKITELRNILGDLLLSEQEESMEEIVFKTLVKQNKTLSTAESCTGGNIAHKITLIAGASQCFCGAIVAYNNNIKQSVLSIKPLILEKYHAVSEQTVIAMAKSVIKLMNTDYAISTSGLAGPNSDGTSVPVGSVWICVANKNGKVVTYTTCYKTTRENFIDRVTNDALHLLLKFIRLGN